MAKGQVATGRISDPAWFGGPHKYGDDLYFCSSDTSSTTDIRVLRSTDGGATWSEPDSANRPSLASAVRSLGSVVNGTVLHIFSCIGSYLGTGTIRWNRFNLDSNTWNTTGVVVNSPTSLSAHPLSYCGVYSDGDPCVVFSSATERIHGTEYDRTAYSDYNGTSWTTPQDLGGGGQANWGLADVVVNSVDRGHVVVNADTDLVMYHLPVVSGTVGGPNTPDREAVYSSTRRKKMLQHHITSGGIERVTLIFVDDLVDVASYKVDGTGTPSASKTVTTDAIDIDSGAYGLQIVTDPSVGTDQVYCLVKTSGTINIFLSTNDSAWSDTGINMVADANLRNFYAAMYRNQQGDKVIGMMYDKTTGTDIFFDETIIEHAVVPYYPKKVLKAPVYRM